MLFAPQLHSHEEEVELLARGEGREKSGLLFRAGGGEIRIEGIHIDPALHGNDNKIHVRHGDGSQKNFIAHDDGAHEGEAVLEAGLNRADIWHHLSRAIRQSDLLAVGNFKTQLKSDMLGDDQKYRPGVGECLCFDRLAIRIPGISEREHTME